MFTIALRLREATVTP